VREYLDNNVAVAARLSSPVEHLDPRTIVEAVPGGWFYLAALPGDEVIVVFITLATLVPSEPRVRLRWWLEALSQTTVVRNTLNGHRLPETLSDGKCARFFLLDQVPATREFAESRSHARRRPATCKPAVAAICAWPNA